MVTEINYKEDLIELKKLVDEFEKIYTTKLGLTTLKDVAPMDYIKRGANKVYLTPKPNIPESKYIRGVQEGMIWLSTDINPNGITGLHDIARTYVIKFEANCQERVKYGRNWYDSTVLAIRYYGYGRTIEETLDNFSKYYHKIHSRKLY